MPDNDSIRSYDIASDPELAAFADEAIGLSCDDVIETMLGSFTGTYTPLEGEPFAIDVTLGIDGIVTVQDVPNHPSTWSAELIFAMSSQGNGEPYLLDELWGPTLTLSDLSAAAIAGTNPADAFGGSIEATGDAQVAANFASERWTGTLSFGGQLHGRFELLEQVA